MKKNILVIIPTYNEKDNVEPIIKATFEAGKKIKNYDLEVLVVEDNSPDGTGKIVKKLMKSNPKIDMLTGTKEGLGRAYIRGFKYGLSKEKYDVFIMMDADFSHDPAKIPELIKALDGGLDFVIGSRYIQGGSIPGNWPLKRIILSRVANYSSRILVGFEGVADITGGFKAIRTDAVKQIDLDNIHATGYFFLVNLLHEFYKRKMRIGEVPIIFSDRQYGASKMSLSDISEYFYRAYKLNPNSRIRRLFRFGMVGLCGTFVNLFVLHALVEWFDVAKLPAAAVAIEVSIISNFLMNNYYTFRLADTKLPHKTGPKNFFIKMVKYNLGAVGGALIAFSVFALLTTGLNVYYLLADAIAIVAAMSWNYWVSVKIVWKIVDE